MSLTKSFPLLSFIGIGVFTLLFSACTPSATGLYRDPSFTYNAMHTQGMAVGGVADNSAFMGNTPPPSSLSYAENLREAFINKSPGLAVMPAGDVAQALGISTYNAMMTYYAQNDSVPVEDLDKLKAHTQNLGYVAFGRIVSNQISHSTSTESEVTHHGNTRDTADDYETTRTVTVQVKIYSLTTHQIVWSGSLTDSITNTNSYPLMHPSHFHNDSSQIIDDVVTGFVNGSVQGNAQYPAAPGSSDVAARAMNELMANLPSAS